MKVLLVGGGGREHALAWKIAQSPRLDRLTAAPGNPGIARLCETRAVAAADVEGQVALALELCADLVVIGPETAIEKGLADSLASAGIACFGPSAAAGRLETSKGFAKAFADRHHIPTARWALFEAATAARAHLATMSAPYVIKADGLAAGKGVVVAATLAEAEEAVDSAFGGKYGGAGARVVIEEFLAGEIGSVFALSDGTVSLPFGAVQDHKRAFEGDKGPNTGGMGAYAPAPGLTDAVVGQTLRGLIDPALSGIAAEGAPYRGALFCEIMVTADGPKLIEFNARFGDPEFQVLMMRLESDVLPYLAACAAGDLGSVAAPSWSRDAVVCVVLAAEGYPGKPRVGDAINGAETDFGRDVEIFHAGTARREDGVLVTAGGRVLNVCARAPDIAQATARANEVADQITFAGAFHRRDIGWRALSPRA
ncbi:MAG: phosphoribosylamine--glycine ligase [Caulobacteraceae bacterium]|nr:phosphoribosylamine--glycine ligase [Caulobacteraceae bacterium]